MVLNKLNDYEIYFISFWQVKFAEQDIVLDRVKREIVYDKQNEFSAREIKDPNAFYRVPVEKLSKRKWVGNSDADEDITFNDPYYKDSWYLVSKKLNACMYRETSPIHT